MGSWGTSIAEALQYTVYKHILFQVPFSEIKPLKHVQVPELWVKVWYILYVTRSQVSQVMLA